MGLAEFQAALAHLYTDAAARELCATDPAAFAARFRLSPDECTTLAGEVLASSREFARSLFQKRFHEARRSIPRTAETLAASMLPLFTEYAQACPLQPGHSPARDALGFLEWLLANPATSLPTPERHALLYEQGWLLMTLTTRPFLVRWLIPDHRTSGTRQLAIWWRWEGKVRHWLL